MNRATEVTKDAFNAVIQIREIPKDVAAETVYQRVKERIDECIARGRESGMAESDVADITYALVALADEFAQSEPSTLAEYWHQQPLQLHYFAENVAGEGYFMRLDHILADPTRVEALVIYHTGLQLGFAGRYAVRGGERELELVRRRVRDALGPLLKAAPLSRHADPPQERARSWSLDFVLLWASLFSLLFAACFWLVLRVSMESMSMELIEHCQHLLDTMVAQAQRFEA